MTLHQVLACLVFAILATIQMGSSMPSEEISQLTEALQLQLHKYATHLEDSAAQAYGRYRRSRQNPDIHHRSRRSPDTRHSFVPGTGVGNREVLQLDDVQVLTGGDLNLDADAWKYIKLSNGDEYIAMSQLGDGKVEIFQINALLPDPLISVFNYTYDAVAMGAVHVTKSARAGLSSIEESFIALASTSQVVFISMSNGNFQVNQTLNVAGVNDIKAVTINSLNYVVLATDSVKSRLYVWSSALSAFEFSQGIATIDSQSVTSFTIGGNVYLAFTQLSNNTVLYRFDWKLSVFKFYLSLDCEGATDVMYFTSAYTHFLAVFMPASNTTLFYKWQLRTFDPFQELSTPNGNSWTELSASNCQDSTFLFLTSGLASPDKIKVYQYSTASGQMEIVDFSVTAFTHQSVDVTTLGAAGAIQLSDAGDGTLYLGVGFPASHTESYLIFQITTSIGPVENQYTDEIISLQYEIGNLTNSIDVYETDVNSTQLRLDDAVTLDGDQEISGIKIFTGALTINGSVTAADLQVEGSANTPLGPGEDENLNRLDEKLNNQTAHLDTIDSLLNDAVTLETNQTVTGHKEITQVTVAGTLVTHNLTADLINGHDIEQLHVEAVRLDRAQTIYGNINFTYNVNITSDLSVTDEINGLDLQNDVVLTDVEQTIAGAKSVGNSVTIEGNMNITGSSKLNGLDVSDQVVTLTGDYTIGGAIIFDSTASINGNIITTGNVDGVDVSDLSSDALTLAGTQTIEGSVTLQTLATFNTDVDVTLVNGNDLSDTDERALRMDENAEVTGKKTFQGPIFMEGNLQVDETVDELDWPNDILTKSGNNVITGHKTFNSDVNVNAAITVDNNVDGLDLSAEVVTKTGNHSIAGVKNFTSGIHVEGDVIVDGTVDGVDVAQLDADMMTLSTTQTVQGDVTFVDGVGIQGSLSVDELVNGRDLFHHFQDAVFKDNVTAQIITGAKTFTEQVTVSSGLLEIFGQVNGHDISTAFLDRVSDQTITGQKTFVNGLSVQNNVTVNGLIQDVNLAQLHEEAVLTWRDAQISGAKTFLSGVDVDGSLITEALVEIDGFDVSEDFMMTNRQQTVTGFMSFNNVSMEQNLSTDNMTIYNTLNGRNWTQFTTNRITLGSDETIWGSHVVSNSSRVTGNITVSGTVNDFQLAELASNILYKSSEQTITGELTFSGIVTVLGDITCDGLVDGMNISDINDRAMFVDENQNIDGVKTFQENVIISGEVDLQGELNNVSLSALFTDAVYDNKGPQYVTADKTFDEGFTANQTVSVSGFVDGIDLSAQMLTKSDDQVVTGSYTFSQDITIGSNLDIDGTVNGVNISLLDSTVMKTNVAQTIETTLTFVQDLHVEDDDIPISGFVDGVNLTDLDLNAVMLDETVNVTGYLYFDAPVTFMDDIHATGLVHGLDFAAWVDEIVTIDTEQTIPNLRTFTDDITLTSGLVVSGNISALNAFGQDLDDFIADAVMLEGDQTITGYKIVAGNVTANANVSVTGNVNGVKVATEVVTLDGNQDIDGIKTFTENITVNDNIVLSGFVNGVDIDVSEGDTFMTNDPENILAKKTFSQNFTVGGDITVGELVDGVDLDQEAVTLDTDQVISGQKTFEDMVVVTGTIDVSGNVCNVNISELANIRLSLSVDETIYGNLSFEGDVTFEQNVTLIGGLNNYNLEELQQTQNEITAETEVKTSELDWVSDYRCMSIDALQYLYYSVYSEMTHLSEIQTFDVHAESFEHFTISGVPHLAMARTNDASLEQCIDSIVYIWDSALQEFVEKERLPTRGGRRWHSFTIDDTQYLAIANSRSRLCTGDAEIANTIYAYNGTHFEHFQDIASGGTNDVASVSIGDDDFLAVANINNNSTVYIFDHLNEEFVEQQSLDIGEATGVEFIELKDGNVLLVFSASDESFTSVFIYDNETQQFTLHQTLDSTTASAITSFEYARSSGLIITNHGHVITSGAELAVYYWVEGEHQFVISAKIPILSAADVKAFVAGGNLYVAAIRQATSLQLFKYEGTLSFQSFQTQELNGVVSVEAYMMGKDVHLAVGVNPADTSTQVYPVVLNGNVIGDSLPDVIDGLCDNDMWSDFTFHDPKE